MIAPGATAPGSRARSRRAPRTVRLGAWSARWDRRSLLVCLALAGAAGGTGVLALGLGDYPLSPPEVVRTLAGDGPAGAHFIVWTLRVPRFLVALLVGAALAVGGAIFQTLTRNPLGSPDIIGFTTGSASGGILMILVFGGGTAQIALGAVCGGLLTALAVYLLAFTGGVHGFRLILVGIGVSAMLEALNAYLLSRAATVKEAQSASAWLVGSLNGRGWEHVRPVAAALLVLLPIVFALAGRLRMLEMGDVTARALGVHVEQARLAIMAAAVALTAVATATAGPIVFIALAAPQLARRLTRAAGPNLIASALMGAFLLALSDLGAQRLLAPTQLPVGVLTGVIGGTYLAWLLVAEWRSGRA